MIHSVLANWVKSLTWLSSSAIINVATYNTSSRYREMMLQNVMLCESNLISTFGWDDMEKKVW